MRGYYASTYVQTCATVWVWLLVKRDPDRTDLSVLAAKEHLDSSSPLRAPTIGKARVVKVHGAGGRV